MIRETFPPAACPEPETLGALAEGRLAGAERGAAVRHLASCRRCHEVFASSLQVLEDEGALPAVSEPAAAPAARRPVMMWLSAAAAALVSAVVLMQRAPVPIPRVADASPTPVAVPTAIASATPGPAAVERASLPPEAVSALRTLNGFQLPYAVPSAVGFAPDPHKAAVRKGIEDVDSAARALAHSVDAPSPAGSVDGWRRVGRILEASRLALVAPPGTADAFFSSPWAVSELAYAGAELRNAGVADASWTDDARGRPIDGDTAQKLLERLDELLAELS